MQGSSRNRGEGRRGASDLLAGPIGNKCCLSPQGVGRNYLVKGKTYEQAGQPPRHGAGAVGGDSLSCMIGVGRSHRRCAWLGLCASKVTIHAPKSAPPMDLSVETRNEPDRPLPVAGLKGTPEEIERQWYEQVYRGRGDSMAQLTWRAVLIGSF